MAASIPTNMDVAMVLTGSGIAYITHHCWAYDRFKCLIPSKKDWFRAGLAWMLIASNTMLCVWSAGYSYLKHKYWYMSIPDFGVATTPLPLYTLHDLALARALNIVITVALWLQVSLNAEEGLYWYHLMRAVRKPRSARAWLNSNFFIAWLVVSATTLSIQMCAILVGVNDETQRAARMYSSMGTMEVTVALVASIVIVQFPRFLEDVKRSGAGREVRTRLYSYHEANKLRTFFRILFSLCAMLLGFDGLTKNKPINMTRWAAESIEQIAYVSYFLASLISVTLYLPRTYSTSPGDLNVMVGGANRGGDDAVSNALMSLLREGGQWDEIDDKRTGTGGTGGSSALNLHKKDTEDEEFGMEIQRNSALDNFISPIAVAPQTNEIRPEIRIHVKQEVVEHRDGGSTLELPPKCN